MSGIGVSQALVPERYPERSECDEFYDEEEMRNGYEKYDKMRILCADCRGDISFDTKDSPCRSKNL